MLGGTVLSISEKALFHTANMLLGAESWKGQKVMNLCRKLRIHWNFDFQKYIGSIF